MEFLRDAVKKSSSTGKSDNKDETARGKISLFSLDNQAKKKYFLSMISTYNFNYFDICSYFTILESYTIMESTFFSGIP